MSIDSNNCDICYKSDVSSRCSLCSSVFYCSTTCSTAGWKVHKLNCNLGIGLEWTAQALLQPTEKQVVYEANEIRIKTPSREKELAVFKSASEKNDEELLRLPPYERTLYLSELRLAILNFLAKQEDERYNPFGIAIAPYYRILMAENLPYSSFRCLEERYDIYSQELHVDFMREYFRFESSVGLNVASKYTYLKGSIDRLKKFVSVMEQGFRTGSDLLNYSKIIDLAEKRIVVMRKCDRKELTKIECEKMLRPLDPNRRAK